MYTGSTYRVSFLYLHKSEVRAEHRLLKYAATYTGVVSHFTTGTTALITLLCPKNPPHIFTSFLSLSFYFSLAINRGCFLLLLFSHLQLTPNTHFPVTQPPPPKSLLYWATLPFMLIHTGNET